MPQMPTLSYWETGANVVRSLGGPHAYACPLCRRLFGRDEVHQLRLGHALPKSLGGKLKVLVCTECEGSSGYELDAHAARFDRLRRILAGEPFKPERRPTRLTVEGITANVEFRSDQARALKIYGLREHNDDRIHNSLWAVFEEYASTGKPAPRMTLTLPDLSASPHRAKVSYLRAGYLAAFAAFGYWAVARPSLDQVRQQIQEPDVEHLSHFFRRCDEPERYGVAIVERPRWASSIVVLMGSYQITLPLLGDGGIYKRIAKKVAARVGEEVPIQLLQWPSRPMYLGDRLLVRSGGFVSVRHR
jgi:hypothetical protein